MLIELRIREVSLRVITVFVEEIVPKSSLYIVNFCKGSLLGFFRYYGYSGLLFLLN